MALAGMVGGMCSLLPYGTGSLCHGAVMFFSSSFYSFLYLLTTFSQSFFFFFFKFINMYPSITIQFLSPPPPLSLSLSHSFIYLR